ncbi:MAG TPA: ammonium transporter [Opitutaceae bacterium]
MRSLLRLLPLALLLAPALHAGRPVDSPSYDLYLDQVLYDESFFPVSNLWGVIAAGLVFLMHLGFATLEAGLARAKHVVNVLYKNVFVVCLGIVAFAVCGFTTMFPGEFNGWFSFHGWAGVPTKDYFDLMTPRYDPYGWWTDFIFQAMIAAKAISIVSGAVAERTKLIPFLIYGVLLTAVAYPVAGAWTWGKGWLFRQGFVDFAGASVVHVFGGFAALACVLLLGARLGKYDAAGRPVAIPGHSMPLATIGMFALWFGWLGFNGGSLRSAHPELLGLVVANTSLGGAAGGLAAMLLTPLLLKKPDLSMALNGVLTGLVAVTGCADIILPHHAVVAGAVGGGLVVLSVVAFDRLHIDDPIGAISVHGIGGLWGALVPAVFASANWQWQVIGALAYALAAFVFTFVVFGALKLVVGVRVTAEQERTGLDISEHGQEAYAPDIITAK